MYEHDREQNIYETGRTRPPKNRHGLIAVVLVAAIFLGSILRYLLNVPLLQLDLSTDADAMPVRFAPSPKLENPDSLPAPSAPVCADVSVELLSAPDTGLSFEDVRQAVAPSVVTVTCRTGTGVVRAAGIVLSENGYILIPCHLLHSALSLNVQLFDGRTLSAAVVGMDRMSGLAVIYAPCSGLTPAVFGNSASVQSGDAVLAAGNEASAGREGAVSIVNDRIHITVKPPVSGAPLLNDRGQIIGVCTDFAVSRCAIPSATVKQIADQLAQQGFVSGRPDPGFSCAELTTLDRKIYSLPPGLYVSAVYADNGLLPGDVLQTLNGEPLSDPDTFYRILYTYPVGATVEFSLIRNDKPQTLRLTLGEATR